MIETIASLFGYLASILLAISLLINNDLKFRWLNTGGCIAFITYGIMIHAFPVILTNLILLMINVFYLLKIYRTSENFDLLPFIPGDDLINKFLSFYRSDIRDYFPEYDPADAANNISFVVLRDLVIANLFSARLMEDGSAIVQINYTVPKYRDYKIGKFLFQKERQFLLSQGIKNLVYTKVFNKKHEAYLLKMGFEKISLEGANVFQLNIL